MTIDDSKKQEIGVVLGQWKGIGLFYFSPAEKPQLGTLFKCLNCHGLSPREAMDLTDFFL